MEQQEKDRYIDPASLPENVFQEKEVFQHKQPADSGVPLEDKNDPANRKESDKSGKEEGLNEEKSEGDAGAFEGFEDQSK